MGNPANPVDADEDLALRAWDGDESVLGDLLMAHASSIERAIARQFPCLSGEAEDIVAEAFQRFWQSRDHYDATQSLRAYLYKIAVNVARNLVSGHLNWQKARLLERPTDTDWLGNVEQPSDNIDETLNAVEGNQKGICKALGDSLAVLPSVERAVIEAYALADGVKVDAGMLGVELGRRHSGGVPIPAGTIRQHKRRAKKKIIDEMRKRGYELDNAGG